MTIIEKHKKILKDLKIVKAKLGAVYDYCSGWCDCYRLDDMLENPNIENAFYHLFSLLENYTVALENNNLRNEEIKKIILKDTQLKEIFEFWNII